MLSLALSVKKGSNRDRGWKEEEYIKCDRRTMWATSRIEEAEGTYCSRKCEEIAVVMQWVQAVVKVQQQFGCNEVCARVFIGDETIKYVDSSFCRITDREFCAVLKEQE